MPTTATYAANAKDELDSGAIAAVAQGAQAVKLGTMSQKIKVVATGLTAGASFDITTAAFLAKCVVTGTVLKTGETLPPIGQVVALRKAAAAAAFPCTVTDAAGTATAGAANAPASATLSDDGKTLGFETGAAVTAFTLVYYPAPAAGVVKDTGP